VSPIVEPGDRLTVSAAVTNTGGTRESQVISVRIGDDVLATRTVGTDPGELLPVTFENVTVPDLDPGEYTYGVYSEDDRNTSTVTVESGDGEPRQVDWHRDHDWEEDPEAATTWDNYDTTELLAVDNLMSIDIAPDGRVFYITRGAPTEPKDTFVTYGHGTAEVGWVDPDDPDRAAEAADTLAAFARDELAVVGIPLVLVFVDAFAPDSGRHHEVLDAVLGLATDIAVGGRAIEAKLHGGGRKRLTHREYGDSKFTTLWGCRQAGV
jgi:hypothetical protein